MQGRAHAHALSQIIGLGRHTIAGLLCTQSRTQADWSADYRTCSRGRLDPAILFGQIASYVQKEIGAREPLVVAWDDSILRKRGWKTHGVAWRRDPLGSHFGVNFVAGQRVLQASAALPLGKEGQARMIPIDFIHCPTARRPGKNAGAAQVDSCKEAARQANINRVALERMKNLRARVESSRDVHFVVDNRFTNHTVLKDLPAATACLLCADPQMDIRKVLQEYLWRWDIEVNFRDEKTLLGVGQARVRTIESTQRVPALSVAACAMLLLAGHKAYGKKNPIRSRAPNGKRGWNQRVRAPPN